MSKAVLISIRPKYVEQICSKIKTIEVRKNRPQIETPFKCYIYCTIGNGIKGDYLVPSGIQCGKVIGSFTCDRIEEYTLAYGFSEKENQDGRYGKIKDYAYYEHNLFLDKMCLTEKEFYNYGKGKTLYGWHISDLKIYGKPRELSEFKKENKCYKKGDLDNIGCWERGCLIQEQGWCDGRYSQITRPPQSYMFIEEI